MLFNIPNELMLPIINYLTPEDLVKVLFTCNKGKQIFDDINLWRFLIKAFGCVSSTITNEELGPNCLRLFKREETKNSIIINRSVIAFR